MNSFDVRQVNNILAGNALACEIEAFSTSNRAFIVVRAVSASGFLNVNPSQIDFWFRKYEVPREYLIHDWDICEDELINSIHLTDIAGLKQLEEVSREHLSDFSMLDVERKCDNPL